MNILLTVPQISDDRLFCSIEYLEPLVYNVTNQCYTGPVEHEGLALIICPDSRSVITVNELSKCFKDHVNLLCPSHVLRNVRDVEWLGLPWHPRSKVPFGRLHRSESDCTNLHPFVHVGGRYFLSLTDQVVTFKNSTNELKIRLSPLIIYNFPCSVQILEAGIDECPQRLELHIPVFTAEHFQYYHWTDHTDSTVLNLYYKSLKIPPPLKFNKTYINSLDKTYNMINRKLSRQFTKIRKDIDRIQETSETTITAILVYIAFPLSAINSIILISIACCYFKRPRHLPNGNPALPLRIESPPNVPDHRPQEVIELKTLLQNFQPQEQDNNS